MAARRERRMAVVGLVVGLGAFGALLWNEWTLARGFAARGDAAAALTAGGGAVVHLVGEARASAVARDPEFGVGVDALRLDRRAETYQWREEREGSGDNKRVRHERVWSPVLIDSRRFEDRLGHVNPQRLRFETMSFRGGEATLDGRRLAPELVDLLPATREIRPDLEGPVRAAGGLSFRRAEDWLYSGDPEAPRVGDVRVRFAAAPEGLVSVVADGSRDELVPWRGRGGAALALAVYGGVPAEELFRESARSDWRAGWALRGFAGLAMTIGAMFALPALRLTGPGRAILGESGRIGAMLLLGVGLSAAACTLGWAGARLLLLLALP